MIRKTKYRLEQELFNAIEDAFSDGIVKKRVMYHLQWYTKRASFYRRLTYYATFFSILTPTVTTLLNGILSLETARIATIVLSFFSSVGAGLYAFLRSKEHWLRYRVTAEKLKKETICYLEQATIEPSANKKREVDFLNKVEAIAAEEVEQWQSVRQFSNLLDESGISTEAGSQTTGANKI